jgi:hypothetical protein
MQILKKTLYIKEASFIYRSISFYSPSFFPSLVFSMEENRLQLRAATFENLTAIQSKYPKLNVFNFPGFLHGTLTLWNVNATDMLPLTHFHRVFSKLLVH